MGLKRIHARCVALVLSVCCGALASAQTLDRKSLSLEGARKAVAAAVEEANKNNWPVVIAVVDDAGDLIVLERTDKAQRASIGIAIGKARTAALFRRSTALLEEAMKTRPALTTVPGVVSDVAFLQGGLPILAGGVQVGAIGVSGVTSPQDEQIAKAGADTVK